MLKVNIRMLKHHLFAAFKALPAAGIIALSLSLAACCKDDPEPDPGPEPPTPPDPPGPVEPGIVQRVALRLQARPAGEDPDPWLPTDTLHLVLTEPDGRAALGDTALYRYVFPAETGTMGGGTAEEAAYFIPASVADSAFLPSDSSLVDLMAYRPASPALQIDRLLLAIDTREQTATGRPLMTAERTIGLHAGEPEASIVLAHRLTRLYVNLNVVESKRTFAATKKRAAAIESTSITLHGNPAQAVWSLPDEKFVEYGDTLPQSFIMQYDGASGYLYTLPGDPARPGGEGEAPPLTLTIQMPDRAPLDVPLNDYLPDGILEAGISIEIRIDVPENPEPDEPDEPDDPDEPDEPDNPDPDNPDNPDPDNPDNPDNPDPDNPDPGPDPTPPVSGILHIQVTLSDWENIIYDVTLYPDKHN